MLGLGRHYSQGRSPAESCLRLIPIWGLTLI